MTPLVALVLGALALPQQQSPVQVRATLSADRIAVGETTVYELVVESGGTSVAGLPMPALPDALDVISTREFSQTNISVPGGRTTVFTRQLVLRAHREGTYVVPAVIVRFGRGVIRRTEPLTLTVEPGTGPQPMLPGGQAVSGSTSGASLVTTLAPDTVWLGEPALLRMTALIPEAQGTRRGRPPSFEPPTVQGFWVEELDDRSAVGMRARGGRYMDLHEYRRMYVPLTSGVHVFPPGRVVYEVGRGWLFSPDAHELRGDTVRLFVRPLPSAGQPESFTGAVGTLEVRASVEPVALTPGDAATLTVELEGHGHIKALPPPRLPDFPGVEVYPPNEDADFTARTSGISGVKRFRWLLVAEHAGTIVLPPIEYAWFDPDAGAYRQATLELPHLVVSRIVAGAADTDTALAPLRRVPGGRPSAWWASTRAFAALQVLPLLLIALASVWRVRGPRIQAVRRARRARSDRLAQVRALATTDPRAALGELEHALSDAIARLLPQPADSALEQRLRAAGVDDQVLAAYEGLRADLAQARFQPAPVRAQQVEELLARVESLLRTLAALLERRGAAAMPALLLLALVQGAPGAGAFERARAAYDAREYADARTEFAAYVRAHPDDASAWYNLGNAELRSGRRGAAIHAWARTVVLEPRAGDARANLRAVDAPDVAAAARRPLPLTAHELRAIAGIAWLVAGTLLAVAMAARSTRARRIGRAGVAALVVCAVAVLALGARTNWPQHGVAVRSAVVRAGPALRAEQSTTLQEGEPARIVEARDVWLLVRTRDGDGWVEVGDFGAF